MEFFGKEEFWDQEYEVVQQGSRQWTGIVKIDHMKSYDSYTGAVPIYGWQVSDSKTKGYEHGKFELGDKLTMKSCIDSLEQGINYCLFKKYWFNNYIIANYQK